MTLPQRFMGMADVGTLRPLHARQRINVTEKSLQRSMTEAGCSKGHVWILYMCGGHVRPDV